MFADRVQEVFFKAMSEGWASGNASERAIPELPFSRLTSSEDGDFEVKDFYIVPPSSSKSSGSTIIWYQGSPIWMMTYGGRYSKAVIPFLKRCLLKAYKERCFYGGRGQHLVWEEHFIYINSVQKGDFEDFYGEEKIFDKARKQYGMHWYRGFSLI